MPELRPGPLTIELCGEPILGLWCERCLKPSGFSAVVLIAGAPCVIERCLDCTDTLTEEAA